MANCYPLVASQGTYASPINWSSITWTPSTPGTGDDVYLNGCVIDLNTNIQVGTIRNTALAGTTTGGNLVFGTVGNNTYISKTGTITISTINTTSSIYTYSSSANRTAGTQGAGTFWKCTDTSFMSALAVGDYVRDASGLNVVQVTSIDDLVNGYFQVNASKNYNGASGLRYSKSITGSGTLFTKELLPNVILKDNSGSFNIIGEISAITSDTTLTLVSSPYGGSTNPGQLGSGLTLKAPVSVYFSLGNPDGDGCNIINGGSGITAIGGVAPLITVATGANNQNLVLVNGKVKGGTANGYVGIHLSAGTNNRTGNSIYLNGGAIGGTSAAAILNANSVGINNNVYIAGISKGGAASSIYGTAVFQNSTITVLRGQVLDLAGGSVGTDTYGLVLSTLSSLDATNGQILVTSIANFNSAYGIFMQNSANINLVNPILYGGIYACILGSTSTGTLTINGGSIYNKDTSPAILSVPKISYSDSVLINNWNTTTSSYVQWKVYGTTNTITAADVWNYATALATTAGSFGKKLSDWVLGSDNKVLLSNNPQTGVTIPTVTTVNGLGTDVITDTSLATSAVTEIRDAIWNELENNTLSLSKITRLQNVSTAQITGDQLASYNT